MLFQITALHTEVTGRRPSNTEVTGRRPSITEVTAAAAAAAGAVDDIPAAGREASAARLPCC